VYAQADRPATTTAASGCEVTAPNGSAPPQLSPALTGVRWYGNGTMWTALWPEGTVTFRPHGPGFVLPDGSLKMKFYWMVAFPGELTIEGRRLDAAAPPLKYELGPRLQDGGNPSYLIFPTAGCWEVTARTNGSTMTFVTRVVQLSS